MSGADSIAVQIQAKARALRPTVSPAIIDMRTLGRLLVEHAELERMPSPEEIGRLQSLLDSAWPDSRSPEEGWNWLDARELAQPLPPVPWVVEGLQLAPGRPSSIQSFGAGLKTLGAASLVMSAAAGLPVWGAFPVDAPKRCRWLDYEMGRRASQRRFQRLAFGLGVNLRDLPLELAALPRTALTSASARDAFMRAGDGMDLLVVDSLRASTRGVDENDSAIRDYVDVLLEVSEETGATCLVLHHVGKTKDAHGDGRQKGRGSSALFDAWGAVFDFTKESESTRLVTMTKPHPEAAGPIEPFCLDVSDVPDGANPIAGVVVRHRSHEHVGIADARADAMADRGRAACLKASAELVQVLMTEPGIGRRDVVGALRARLGQCGSSLAEAALSLLGDAVHRQQAPRGGHWLFLRGERLPDAVLGALPTEDRPKARATKPPAEAFT